MADTTGIKKLYKSRTERMIDGVCGGVAKYFNLDPTLVRIAWVLLTFLGGSGIILYIVAMIVMPKEPYIIPDYSSESTRTGAQEAKTDQSQKNSLFWGILLIVVGGLLFLHNMGVSIWHQWWSMDWDLGLAVLLILIGVGFLWGGRNSLSQSNLKPEDSIPASDAGPAGAALPRKLYRSFTDSKLFGVCGGLAEHFGLDSTIIRIGFIAGALLTSGVVVVGYIVLAIVVPKAIPVYKAV